MAQNHSIAKSVTRTVAIAVGVVSLAWIVVEPDHVNVVLVVLWCLIAARGLIRSLFTLRRVYRERRTPKNKADPELALIASGNVRRHLYQSAKLTAFLIVGLSVLFGVNNVVVSRFLIVFILILMSAGADQDADEIERFDRMTAAHKEFHTHDHH